MNFVASFLLQKLPEQEAYWIFYKVMQDEAWAIRNFYMNDLHGLLVCKVGRDEPETMEERERSTKEHRANDESLTCSSLVVVVVVAAVCVLKTVPISVSVQALSSRAFRSLRS